MSFARERFTALEDEHACRAYLQRIFPAVDIEQCMKDRLKGDALLLRFAKFAQPWLSADSFSAAYDALHLPHDYAPGAKMANMSRQAFLIACASNLQTFAHSEESLLRNIILQADGSTNDEIELAKQRTASVKGGSMLRISNADLELEVSDCSDTRSHANEPRSARNGSFAHFRINALKQSFSENYSPDCSTAPEFSVVELHSTYTNTHLAEKLDIGDCAPCEENLPCVNVLVCGAEKVGKTSLGLRMLTGEFINNVAEIGRFDRSYEGENGEFRVILREQFDKKAVKWADVCLVCFSLMDRQSFEYVKSIIAQLGKWGERSMILVGCKADERLANISSDEIMNLFPGQGIKYVSCSASRGIGVLKLIGQLEEYIKT